jgi:hypothetical protein
MALNKTVSAIDSAILVGSVSEKQDMLLGLQTNVIYNNFYGSSYIYTLNERGEFVVKVKLNNSVTGYAFGSSCFLLNDAYLVVLQLQNNTSVSQISLYSLLDQSYKEDSRIPNVYSSGANGYFCSC